MWFFSKKTVAELGILRGLTDIHSHLLWGVDDGAKSSESTLKMINLIKELGVKRIFCTPHIMSNLLSNSSDYLTQNFNEKISPISNDHGIEFRLAAEYMLDDSFLGRLHNEIPLTYDGLHILIELSYLYKPINFDEIMYDIVSSDYIPILAHPERYTSFISQDEYVALKKQGVKFQLNIISLSGIYGKDVKLQAEKMLLAGLYNFIGTDMHSSRMVKTIGNIKISSKIKTRILELVSNNNQLWKY